MCETVCSIEELMLIVFVRLLCCSALTALPKLLANYVTIHAPSIFGTDKTEHYFVLRGWIDPANMVVRFHLLL